jgi:hypothetical protein
MEVIFGSCFALKERSFGILDMMGKRKPLPVVKSLSGFGG